MKLVRDKWLTMNKEAVYMKVVKITNKLHIQNLGNYLDTVKNKWLNKIKRV